MWTKLLDVIVAKYNHSQTVEKVVTSQCNSIRQPCKLITMILKVKTSCFKWKWVNFKMGSESQGS